MQVVAMCLVLRRLIKIHFWTLWTSSLMPCQALKEFSPHRSRSRMFSPCFLNLTKLIRRYSIHLWFVTIIYCLALVNIRDPLYMSYIWLVEQPLQIWNSMKWVTIPATVILVWSIPDYTSSVSLNLYPTGLYFLRIPCCRRRDRE